MREVHYRPALQWCANIFAFTCTIVMNGLANGIPLGGQTTGEISDKYPSLFTPAGYVFSIWGLIYLTLTVFIIWQALPKQRNNPNLTAIHIPFLLSCVANGGWILAWHYDQLVLSLALMTTLLLTLIRIYQTLGIGCTNVSTTERLVLHLPFSLYLGWITVAMIANLSAWQIASGWDDAGVNAITWTIIKLVVAATISTAVLLTRRDIAFMLVTVWASAGIAFKHTATTMVGGSASAVALFGLGLIAYQLARPGRSN